MGRDRIGWAMVPVSWKMGWAGVWLRWVGVQMRLSVRAKEMVPVAGPLVKVRVWLAMVPEADQG